MSFLKGLNTNPQLASRLLNAATVLLWVIAVIIAAQLTWWLVAPAEPQAGSVASVAAPEATASNQAVKIAKVQRLNLFGQASQTNTQTHRSAPQTTLNIRLVGVSASSNPARSAAIIEQSGQQQTYIVGDTIARSNVTVETIYADRVILDNNGRLETLQLEDIGEDRPALSLVVDDGTQSNEQSREQKTEQGAKQEVTETLQQVAQGSASLDDYVTIEPVINNGQLQGYRLSPGKNPQVFRQAGFQNGDLAVAINGYDLTDMQQAMLLSNELNGATQVVIQVERQGQRQELTLELPQSQGK